MRHAGWACRLRWRARLGPQSVTRRSCAFARDLTSGIWHLVSGLRRWVAGVVVDGLVVLLGLGCVVPLNLP